MNVGSRGAAFHGSSKSDERNVELPEIGHHGLPLRAAGVEGQVKSCTVIEAQAGMNLCLPAGADG